jgi:DNA-cytosine methyltransferase
MQKGINVLSLFDGISGAYEALIKCGIPIGKYYASEIDKNAIAISKYNHPDIIHIGDVTKIKGEDYKSVDLLCGGSPCQNLSVSGDRTGLEGEESKLFYEYVRLKNEINPKYFLLENVASMTKENRNKMSALMGCEPILLNSKILSAQNRERYYWTNINNGKIDQPKDLKIYLKDIIVDGGVDRDKSYCIDASYAKGGGLENYINKGRRQIVINENNPICVAMRGRKNEEGEYIQKLEFNKEGKTNTITTVGKDNMILLGNLYESGGQAGRVYDIIGKSVTQQSEGGGGGGKGGLYFIPPKKIIGEDNLIPLGHLDKNNCQGYRVYDVNGKSITQTAAGGGLGKNTGLYFIPPFNFKLQRTEQAKQKRKELKQSTGKDHSDFQDKELIPRMDGKSVTVMCNMGDENLLFEGIKIDNNEDENNKLIDNISEKYPNLSTEEIIELIKKNIRMLYPIEAERLQTLPDNFTQYGINEKGEKYEISKTQRYRAVGNGFTINIISYILSWNKEWCESPIFEVEPIRQISLF